MQNIAKWWRGEGRGLQSAAAQLVEHILGIEGLLVRYSLESLGCARHFISCFVLVQSRKTGIHPEMSKKLLGINMNKEAINLNFCDSP